MAMVRTKRPASLELSPEELVLRDAEHDAAWMRAAEDPDFRRETEEIIRGFANADREMWLAG